MQLIIETRTGYIFEMYVAELHSNILVELR